MGWGNHHASYDEKCTQEDVYRFRQQLAEDTADSNDSIRQEDYQLLRRFYTESRDMIDTSAVKFWYDLFPRYRLGENYYGPRPPIIEDHWEKRLPPTPVIRNIESPLWWAKNNKVFNFNF